MHFIQSTRRDLLPGTEPVLSAVADDVYAVVQLDGSWGLSNAALVVCDGEALLVDTFFTEQRNVRLRGLVDSIAPVPPRYLVNTHHHGDHVHGNGWFPEAIVVAHRSARAAMVRLDPSVSARRFSEVEFGETRLTLPSITFQDSLRIHVGALSLDVIAPQTAHCPGNTVVHIPERGVLVAGDLLLHGCTPTFVGGSAYGFLAVIASLKALNPRVIVTGHGAVCGPEILDETADYIRFILATAENAVNAGRSPLAAALSADLTRYATWHDPERIVGNLYRAMSELVGGGVDLPAMWRDTTTFLGHGVRSRA
jgi:cyclase